MWKKSYEITSIVKYTAWLVLFHYNINCPRGVPQGSALRPIFFLFFMLFLLYSRGTCNLLRWQVVNVRNLRLIYLYQNHMNQNELIVPSHWWAHYVMLWEWIDLTSLFFLIVHSNSNKVSTGNKIEVVIRKIVKFGKKGVLFSIR